MGFGRRWRSLERGTFDPLALAEVVVCVVGLAFPIVGFDSALAVEDRSSLCPARGAGCVCVAELAVTMEGSSLRWCGFGVVGRPSLVVRIGCVLSALAYAQVALALGICRSAFGDR